MLCLTNSKERQAGREDGSQGRCRGQSSHRQWSSMVGSQGTCGTPEGCPQGERLVQTFLISCWCCGEARNQPLDQKRRVLKFEFFSMAHPQRTRRPSPFAGSSSLSSPSSFSHPLSPAAQSCVIFAFALLPCMKHRGTKVEGKQHRGGRGQKDKRDQRSR